MSNGTVKSARPQHTADAQPTPPVMGPSLSVPPPPPRPAAGPFPGRPEAWTCANSGQEALAPRPPATSTPSQRLAPPPPPWTTFRQITLQAGVASSNAARVTWPSPACTAGPVPASRPRIRPNRPAAPCPAKTTRSRSFNARPSPPPQPRNPWERHQKHLNRVTPSPQRPSRFRSLLAPPGRRLPDCHRPTRRRRLFGMLRDRGPESRGDIHRGSGLPPGAREPLHRSPPQRKMPPERCPAPDLPCRHYPKGW